MATIQVKNISKGVAFVHTYSNGIKVLKSGEFSEFETEDLAYLQEVLDNPHFSIDKEAEINEPVVEESKDEEQVKDGEQVEEGQEEQKNDDQQENIVPSQEEINTKAEIKKALLAEAEKNNLVWVEESLLAEVDRIYKENKLAEERKAIYEDLVKAVRGNNKKRIEELMAKIELTPEEKLALFPPKPANNSNNNRKKNNKR